MKIISRFKDYYDYVQHVYGGGDPKVVYKRDYVIPDRSMGAEHYESQEYLGGDSCLDIPDGIETLQEGQVVMHDYRALIVMGKRYILEQTVLKGDLRPGKDSNVLRDWRICTRPILSNLYSYRPYAMVTKEERVGPETHITRAQDERAKDWERFVIPQGTPDHMGLALCKKYGAPVLVVDQNRIYGRVPKLGELGFAQYYSAEALYQELAMFISNTLAPYTDPPSPMTDIEKVTAHGFDKKASFRHRK